MRGDAAPEHVELVASLQDGNDAPPRVRRGDDAELLRDPGMVCFEKPQHGHPVVAMPVESRGNEKKLGSEPLERELSVSRHGIAELLAGAARAQGDVDHPVRSTLDATVRIKRVLESRD